jgi:hypothetical protein
MESGIWKMKKGEWERGKRSFAALHARQGAPFKKQMFRNAIVRAN